MEKNKIIQKALGLLTFILMLSCAGLSDVSENLGGGYTYWGEGGNLNMIYYSLPESKSTTMDTVIIYPAVKAYDFNPQYIVVYQEPDKEGTYSYLQFMSDSTKADSIIEKSLYFKKIFSNEHNYWIIQKKLKYVFGPLTKEEYVNKSNELDIPNDCMESILKK